MASLVNRIANGLVEKGFKKGDSVAIDMPMTLEAVAIYLACIKAGVVVVTIADSFASHEIAVRLDITKPKLVFTQDVILRSGKVLPLYHKFSEIKEVSCVVIPVALSRTSVQICPEVTPKNSTPSGKVSVTVTLSVAFV